MNSSVLMPACAFGERAEVRPVIRKLCRKAWKIGSWEPVFGELEMIEFQQRPGWIALSGVAAKIPWPKERWNLNRFAEEVDQLATRERAWGKARQLHLEGMDTCWYCVTLLNGDINGLWGLDCPNQETQWYLRLLERYVRWLPEMMSLQPYLTHDDLRAPECRFSLEWAWPILCYLHRLGIIIEHDKLYDEFAGDLLRALGEYQVIEPDGDRFKLGAAVNSLEIRQDS